MIDCSLLFHLILIDCLINIPSGINGVCASVRNKRTKLTGNYHSINDGRNGNATDFRTVSLRIFSVGRILAARFRVCFYFSTVFPCAESLIQLEVMLYIERSILHI